MTSVFFDSHSSLVLYPKQQTVGAEVEEQRRVSPNLPSLPADMFLRRGLERMGQVCRIDIVGADVPGTGLLIGPDLVLTNYHVLREIIENDLPPAFLEVYFDFHGSKDSARKATIPKTEWLISTSPNSPASTPFDHVPTDRLDYALVRLEQRVADDQVDPQRKRGWIPISPVKFEFEKDRPLLILGHPLGQAVSLDMDTRSILRKNHPGSRVRYRTNTKGGSSGSPCFDFSFNLVAIHHGGDTGDPPQFNEGIPVNAIFNYWKGLAGGHGVGAEAINPWQQSQLMRILTQNF